MRATTILSSLALATAVIGAPAPRPINNGDISDSNPMDPEGDLAARGSVTVTTEPQQLKADAKTALNDLKKLGHGAGEKVPVKVNVSPRQAGLPTSEITDLADELKDALPIESITDMLPVDTDAITEDLPLPIRRRQLDALPVTEVTGVVDDLTEALPVQNLKDALPVDIDSITGDLPLPIRRRDLTSLLDPVTSTLDLVVSRFTSVLQGLSSASTKLNAMVPAHVENADAVMDNIMSTLNTVQPELNSAIDTIQAGDAEGLLNKAMSAGSGKTVGQVYELLNSADQMLTQMSKDADAIAGLGVTGYFKKVKSLQGTITSMLAQVKKASGVAVPL